MSRTPDTDVRMYCHIINVIPRLIFCQILFSIQLFQNIFHHNSMIKTVLLLLSLLVISIVGQNYHDDNVSLTTNGAQEPTNKRTCYCTSDEICEGNSKVCHVTNIDHVCFEQWTKTVDDDVLVSAGCIYNHFFFRQIMCNINKTNALIICCRDRDMCNDRDAYAQDVYEKFSMTNDKHLNKPSKHVLETPPTYKHHPVRLVIAVGLILFIVTVFSSLLLLTLFCIKRRKRRNCSNRNRNRKTNRTGGLLTSFRCQSGSSRSTEQSEHMSDDSSKGADDWKKPKLIPTGFAKQITLEKRIGTGGYGSVYRAVWHNDIIAVKIFLSSEEPSWSREVKVYEQFRLNHENVLRFIAADNIDYNNRIELWLATEYHENGSLYDYLSIHTIPLPIMLKMVFGIANGLFYLHIAIEATNGKPALAHRDLKTKNILVKKDLSCCIADLGLAVREVRPAHSGSSDEIQQNVSVVDICPNHRAGTIRYMAPEILDKSFNDQNFESYKATDLYALGLVLWEVLRRCQTKTDENDAEPYQTPYQNVTVNNPSYDQMREAVCEKKLRPMPSPRWEHNPILQSLFGLCQELWTENPACRPNCYVVKEKVRNYQNQ